jgi:hypothetical protein
LDSATVTLGAAGACPEISFGGKTWKIGHPTGRAKAALEELAVGRAVWHVRELKGVLPHDDYQATFRELTASISAGDYKTWGDGWQRMLFSGVNNGVLFVLALLRECHPEATEADARNLAANEPEQVNAALARVIPDFLCKLLDGLPLSTEERTQAEARIRGSMAA